LSPTLTSAGTMAGMILGTAAYMSPEQARGKPVDRRVDIWAFGCVLYEMLCRKPAHSGETVSDTLASVILREPNWELLPTSTPQVVRRVIERCLRKDPRARLRDAGDARVLIEEVIAGEADEIVGPGQVASGAGSGAGRWVWLLGAVALIGGIGLGYLLHTPPPEAPEPRTHFRITEPTGIASGPLSISPPGTHVVYPVADDTGRTHLWVRSLDSATPRQLSDMSGATQPFWSPDGQQVGFWAEGKLWRIGLEGGSLQPIGGMTEFYGATWSDDDVILAGQAGPILRFDTTGVGDATPVTEKAEYESGHMWPDFLPDGKRFVYLADSGEMAKHRIVLGSLDGEVSVTLASAEIARSNLRVDPEGRLLWVRGHQLISQTLDFDAQALTGTPQLLADHVLPVGSHHAMAFSVADTDLIGYQQGSGTSELVWLDRAGRRLETVGERGSYANPTLSPDGKLLAVEIQSQERNDERPIWIYDLDRGARTLLTRRETLNDSSTWTPDGRNVIFDSPRGEDKKWRIYSKPASGSGEVVELLADEEFRDLIVHDLSDDGRWLMFSLLTEDRGWDVYIADLEQEQPSSVEWLSSKVGDDYARFSPDGAWIAYSNPESGEHEVYLRPRDLERRTERHQISVQGGHEPKWRRDGRELFYRDERGKFFAVPVDLDADPIAIGIPQELFQIKTPVVEFERDTYDVAPDGERFLVNATTGADEGAIHLISGWRPVGRSE